MHPSIHPTIPLPPPSASPLCTHSSVAKLGPTWGRCSAAAGVRCRTARSGADQGGELRAAGVGARVLICLYTPGTSGLHGWSLGGSPPWVRTRVGADSPGSRTLGGVRSWQGKGCPA